MAIQYSADILQDHAGNVSTRCGANFTIEIRTGGPPANCAAADTGTLLNSFPNSNFASVTGGSVSLSGTPYTATAVAGTASVPAHFRFKTSPGGVCKVQGTVATSGGDMTVDVASITSGQTINLSGYTLTIGGA